MTIHRALSELKLLDARIEKAITEVNPVAINQKGKKIDGHITEDDFKNSAMSSWQSVNDLIARKVAIKSKIVESNSKTMVKVGDKDYTVADAITFKKIIEHKTKLSTSLAARLRHVVGVMNKNNEQVNKNADQIVNASLSGDASKATKETVDNIAKPYLENNAFYLFDPLSIQEKITALETEAGTFSTEIDAVLSESNAVTIINL